MANSLFYLFMYYTHLLLHGEEIRFVGLTKGFVGTAK